MAPHHAGRRSHRDQSGGRDRGRAVAICPAITPAFAKLESLKIDPGWRRAVQARLGGVLGCTDLVELLGPLATTAYQTIDAWRAQHQRQVTSDRPHLDSFHTVARDGKVVRVHYPRRYTGPWREVGA